MLTFPFDTGSALKILENNQNTEIKHERTDVLGLTGGGVETPTSDSTTKRDSTPTPLSAYHNTKGVKNTKRRYI